MIASTLLASRGIDERGQQIDKFKAAFADMNRELLLSLTEFQVKTPNVEGLQEGFLIAENNYLTNYLINDWIGRK
jgi:hypothetical protein